MNLVPEFQKYIKEQNLFSPKDKLLLAVSGGVDSVVLCELCRQAGYDFVIAHCNFQLRGEDSDRDEQFVKKLADKYKVPFYLKTFDTKSIAEQQKKSIEETARDLRYAWFHELILSIHHSLLAIDHSPLPIHIVTAHHADDNIETMAMKFFRGTGIKGLRGMLPKNGKIVRPLLFARKREIEDFAWANQLEHVTDQTNYEDAYARNFFRNRLIPMFKAVYPEVEQNLLNNIERFAEVEQLYEQAIALHKKKLIEQKGNEVHIPVLKLKKTAPLHSVVYEIIRDYNFTSHQTGEVIALLESETGKYVASSTHRVIRNRKWLIITAVKAEDSYILVIDAAGNYAFEQGSLSVEMVDVPGSLTGSDNIAQLDAAEVVFPLLLRKWKTGDYFYPLGMKKKKKLSRFFIDQKLSKTEKENIWVVESNQHIAWVVGHRIDDRFKITSKTSAVTRLTFLPQQ